MSLHAAASETQPRNPLRYFASLWDYQPPEKAINLILALSAAIFFSYAFMAVQTVAIGSQAYRFGDFFALWTSAVVTHDGHAALNFDADALHARQVELGMHPEGYNPFPYPPTLLLLLGPLGRFSLGTAYWFFMVPSFALYIFAVGAGRWREWQWPLGAAIAPATGITIISGQTGFLAGALMIGGLRLAASRPILSGVLFGLLAYKPQLGVLVPVALVAAGLWRTIAAAAATVVVCIVASSLVYGVGLWPLFAHSIFEYAGGFHPVAAYMPTIYANAIMFGAPPLAAMAVQLCVTVPVACLVWRAFRDGPTARASALLLIGTFLATPHAFNYDMPMLTPAIIWYASDRYRASRGLDLGEIVALLLILIMPVLMLNLKTVGMPMSWAPEGLLFLLIARPFGEVRARPLAAQAG